MKFILLIALLMMSGCDGLRSVPSESCKSVPSGKKEYIFQTICSSYNAQGVCMVTTYVPVEIKEVTTVCTFKEYK